VNIVLTLDYEIYFGAHSGSAQKTLLEPTDALMSLAHRYGVPLVFFVDAMWLLRLQEEAPQSAALMAEHYRVNQQLERLVRAGHELQLHVHPHWRDSTWTGSAWQMDLQRYRLHAFSDAEIADMVARCTEKLRSLSGGQAVTAFRAGGWCIQPFDRLRQPLLDAGIRIDSTVYAGGRQEGATHAYDFTAAPALSRWQFEDDPLKVLPGGSFLEVPIASHRVSPLWFWRLALVRKLGLRDHRALGEGAAVMPSRADLARKLLRATTSVVSIDGTKSGFLEAAYQRYQRAGTEDFVVIGHPKALTRYSLDTLEQFLSKRRGDLFLGLNAYRNCLSSLPKQTPGCKPAASQLKAA
jgi:peptidoglycan/xylan/chitin deacetylase (PgdA/CDA1 family)